MKIALAQIETVAGDIEGNSRRIKEAAASSAERGADLVVFPELTVSGYDPRDLLRMPSFLEAAKRAVEDLAAFTAPGGRPALAVGYPEPNRERDGAPAFNSCALVHQGEVVAVGRKCLLPSYDVLEEHRHFEPGREVTVATLGGLGVGLSICEDIWSSERFHDRRRHRRDPVRELARAGADIVLNLSASPFHAGKPARRERMVSALAAEHGVQVVMTNSVGGNDGTVFDGTSLAAAADGQVVVRCDSFTEDIRIFDTSSASGRASPVEEHEEAALDEIHSALVLGIRDYFEKCGLDRALLGLSGGLDSALVATLAAEALGPGRILAVAMPSRYSSDASLADGRALADSLGMELREISIEKPFSSCLEVLEPHLWPPSPETPERSRPPIDLTHENIQPRIRAIYLMALSNGLGHLLLAPGNKSELAVGYTTLYGDMTGALAPIGDVLKTTAFALARRINEKARREIIPGSIITKAPSAELRPGQCDQDSLPPYEVLDPIVSAFVEEGLDLESIVERGHDREIAQRVIEMIVRAEYKRRQAPPVIKVSPAPFTSGYRLPLAQGYV